MTLTELSGWGRTPRSFAHLVHPSRVDEVVEQIANSTGRGTIARGLGRSYGDPAQNAGGIVIDMTGLRGITSFDETTGVVSALGGTSLHDLMRWLIPMGWFVPVTPGTRYVTVGGAIANDIHGKNHHAVGSWGEHVLSIDLATPNRGVITISPTSEPDLFWATVGGIGLTGVIVAATFRMKPIATSSIVADTDKTRNVEDVMALMTSGDADYEFSVAWIDLSTTGRALGRSVLERGRFATADELPEDERDNPLAYAGRELIPMPITAPPHLLNPLMVRALNEAWYRKSPTKRRGRLLTIPWYFHPLDMMRNWNRGYGPAGLLQWQIVVPLGAEETMLRVVTELAASGCASIVNVLKRFGPGDAGMLSFPSEGWTLSVDLAAEAATGAAVLDRLDTWVLEAGGRHYLAKDSRMRPETFAAGYPKLAEWRRVRETVDPERVFQSDLARRLDLI